MYGIGITILQIGGNDAEFYIGCHCVGLQSGNALLKRIAGFLIAGVYRVLLSQLL